MSELSEISLHGLEERGSKRRKADGFCEIAKNVRPDGVGDNVVWKPVHDFTKYQSINLLPAAFSTGHASIRVMLSNIADQDTVTIGLKLTLPNGKKIDLSHSETGSNITTQNDLLNPFLSALQANNDLTGFYTISKSTYTYIDTFQEITIDYIQFELNATTATPNHDIEASFYTNDHYYINFLDGDDEKVLNTSTDVHFMIDGGRHRPGGDIVKTYWQLRNYYGQEFTTDKTASLSRLIAVYDDALILLERDGNNLTQTVTGYHIDQFSLTHIDFARNDETTLITISNDKTGILLALVDDTFVEVKSPPLPKLEFVTETMPAGMVNNLPDGIYGLRVSYVLNDGGYVSFSEVTTTEVGKRKVVLKELPSNLGVWKGIVRGVVVQLSNKVNQGDISGQTGAMQNYQYQAAIAGKMFYKLGEIPLRVNSELFLASEQESIEVNERIPTDILNADHSYFGGKTKLYNGRFIITKSSVKFARPIVYRNTFNQFPSPLSGSTGPTPSYLFFVAKIKTGDGVFYVKGDIWYVPSDYTKGILELLDEEINIYYPDKRCVRMYVFNDISSSAYSYCSIKMHSADGGNYSYGVVEDDVSSPLYPDFNGDGDERIFLSDIDTEKSQIVGNRLNVSELNNPFIYRAKNTHRIGSYDNTTILGVETNAMPISEGQFGQYPLYVFTNNSVWSLEVQGGDDVVFSRISPVTSRFGAINENAFINVDQVIVFASQEGIQSIVNGKLSYIGGPVEKSIRGNLDNIIISSFNSGEQREVWFNTGEKTLVYHTRFNRWTHREENYNQILPANAFAEPHMLQNGDIYFYDTTQLKSIHLKTYPIHFGAFDYLKKLRNTHIRLSGFLFMNFKLIYDYKSTQKTVYDGSTPYFRSSLGSAYAFIIEMVVIPEEDEANIDVIQMEYNYRYTRRIRN